MIENQSRNNKVTPLLQINPKFRDLIPPLSEHELVGLEEEIKYWGGCYNPIFTWKGVIVDGHNRYEICKRIGAAIKYEEMEFADEDAAKIWIIDNQIARRNISLYVRGRLILEKKKILSSGQGYRSDIENKDEELPQNSGEVDLKQKRRERETDRKLAKECGISHDTLSRISKIEKIAPPDMKKSLIKGDISINDAFTKIRQEEKRKENINKLESIEVKEAKAIQGVYDVIVLDPPWPMQKIERDVAPEQVGFDYPTMSLDEIKALDVPCAEDCHVFLWTTQKFLRASFEILDAWNLKYIWQFVWVKNGGFQPFNLPQSNAEFILYAHKGNPKFVDLKNFNTAFQADRGKHSEKPQAFYDMIRRVTAGRRLDMFNRRSIEGFDGWGKEAAAVEA